MMNLVKKVVVAILALIAAVAAGANRWQVFAVTVGAILVIIIFSSIIARRKIQKWPYWLGLICISLAAIAIFVGIVFEIPLVSIISGIISAVMLVMIILNFFVNRKIRKTGEDDYEDDTEEEKETTSEWLTLDIAKYREDMRRERGI